jgi:mRNA interferase MazF
MAEKQAVRHPRRGDIYLVNFDPTLGAEIQRTRPALIIQNDIGNRTSDITIVAAISSQLKGKRYPFEVILPATEGGLTAETRILLNQVRSIDKRRLVRRLGKIPPARMREVERALLISFGISTLERSLVNGPKE